MVNHPGKWTKKHKEMVEVPFHLTPQQPRTPNARTPGTHASASTCQLGPPVGEVGVGWSHLIE